MTLKKLIFATFMREILVKYRLHAYPCSLIVTLRSYIEIFEKLVYEN